MEQTVLRITPAYAGKTASGLFWECPYQDHPRLRGENRYLFQTLRGRRGSPPPTRGKHNTSFRTFGKAGITPAYAGKTTSLCRMGLHRGDHPRLRGENRKRSKIMGKYKGSPPPTRGKPLDNPASMPAERITPAYAGKTTAERGKSRKSKDHPRLRGENHVPSPRINRRRGSPPPTRGKLAFGRLLAAL